MTDLSSDAKALLRKARTEFSPGENRLAKVRSALATQIAAPQADLGANEAAPRSTGAPAATATTWTVAHSIGTAVLIAALGAAGLATWRTRASSVATPGGQPISEKAVARPSPAEEPLQGEKSADRAKARPADPRVSQVQGAGDLLAPAAPTAGGRTQGRPRSKTDVLREISAAPPVAAPVTTPPTAVTAPSQAAPVTVPPAPEADSLAEEVRLLRDARAALDRADPSRALGFLDVHASRFPRGTLYEERLATRVLAFCALGRVDAARLAAQELERAAPRSPHLGRVRASCIAAPASP